VPMSATEVEKLCGLTQMAESRRERWQAALAGMQASQRRLVAEGAPPQAVFAAVTEEVGVTSVVALHD
jgi:hypothetical protein